MNRSPVQYHSIAQVCTGRCAQISHLLHLDRRMYVYALSTCVARLGVTTAVTTTLFHFHVEQGDPRTTLLEDPEFRDAPHLYMPSFSPLTGTSQSAWDGRSGRASLGGRRAEQAACDYCNHGRYHKRGGDQSCGSLSQVKEPTDTPRGGEMGEMGRRARSARFRGSETGRNEYGKVGSLVL